MVNYSTNEKQLITKEMSDKIFNDQYSITEDELKKDTDWIEASKEVYKELEGVEWAGADEDLAVKGLEMMSRFNFNLTLGTINYTAKLQDADDKTKLSFYYMMDMYDKKDISTNGTLRAFKEIGLDPASYIGLSSFGLGFVGKAAATATTKAGLKEMFKQGALKFLKSPVGIGAIESGIYTGVDDIARQEAAIGAGLQDEFSTARAAVATTVGAVVGGGAVKAIGGVGKLAQELPEAVGRVVKKATGVDLDSKIVPDGPATKIEGTDSGRKVIFHGTAAKFEDFDVEKTADGTIWFTDNKSKIEKGEVAAAGKGQIMERVIDENKLKLAGWDEEDKFSTGELIDQGFDGLKLVDGDETTYQIFFPEKLEKLTKPKGDK